MHFLLLLKDGWAFIKVNLLIRRFGNKFFHLCVAELSYLKRMELQSFFQLGSTERDRCLVGSKRILFFKFNTILCSFWRWSKHLKRFHCRSTTLEWSRSLEALSWCLYSFISIHDRSLVLFELCLRKAHHHRVGSVGGDWWSAPCWPIASLVAGDSDLRKILDFCNLGLQWDTRNNKLLNLNFWVFLFIDIRHVNWIAQNRISYDLNHGRTVNSFVFIRRWFLVVFFVLNLLNLCRRIINNDAICITFTFSSNQA